MCDIKHNIFQSDMTSVIYLFATKRSANLDTARSSTNHLYVLPA